MWVCVGVCGCVCGRMTIWSCFLCDYYNTSITGMYINELKISLALRDNQAYVLIVICLNYHQLSSFVFPLSGGSNYRAGAEEIGLFVPM